MKPLWDLHLHTDMSFDGRQTVIEACEAALAAGLTGIAVTNHVDFDGIKHGIYPAYDEREDRRQIEEAKERYAGRLTVLHGVELGQAHVYPEETLDFLKKSNFDYILASLHNLKDCPDFYFFAFDKMGEPERHYWFDKNLDELIKIARLMPFHTLGHVVYPLRPMASQGVRLPLERHYPKLRELFTVMAEQQTALEINTSGLRSELGETLPNEELVEMYRDCGGTLLAVGSDGHLAEQIGFRVEETVAKYEAKGFTLLNRQPAQRKIRFS